MATTPEPAHAGNMQGVPCEAAPFSSRQSSPMVSPQLSAILDLDILDPRPFMLGEGPFLSHRVDRISPS